MPSIEKNIELIRASTEETIDFEAILGDGSHFGTKYPDGSNKNRHGDECIITKTHHFKMKYVCIYISTYILIRK